MKIVLIIIGTLAGLYALAATFQFMGVIMNTNANSAYGTANIAASVAPICLGLIVCLVCYSAAFRKRKP